MKTYLPIELSKRLREDVPEFNSFPYPVEVSRTKGGLILSSRAPAEYYMSETLMGRVPLKSFVCLSDEEVPRNIMKFWDETVSEKEEIKMYADLDEGSFN